MLISDTAEGPGTPNPHLRCLTGDPGVGMGFGHLNLIHPKLSLGVFTGQKGETTPKDECGCFLLKWGGTKPVDIWDECH